MARHDPPGSPPADPPPARGAGLFLVVIVAMLGLAVLYGILTR